MNILLTGGTGFIGRELQAMFQRRGDRITILTRRNRSAADDNVTWVQSLDELDDYAVIDAIINLAGESVAGKRWSSGQKQKLIDSRIDTTRSVVALVHRLKTRPNCLISASATGYYGAQDDSELDEQSSPNREFTHELCRQWEAEACKADESDVRICLIRLGVVLGSYGGMLSRMLPAFRFCVGGRTGSGKQYISWIHMQDVLAGIDMLLHTRQCEGIFNFTAPNPVTNAEFSKTLGRCLNRPAVIPMPSVIVKGLFGEMGDRLLLHGQKAVPRRLLEAGFVFKYTSLESALQASI